MKTFYHILIAACCTLFITACDKELEFDEQFAPLAPQALDNEAGSWRMIVLDNPAQIALPAPAEVSSTAYQEELAAIKKVQALLSDRQREIIKYWSAGGVIRWNQFMRELVARYNLPPAPAVGGGYLIPDPENPFADPSFPFANPPYAARAYSYVSVAQYEALKAAWYYKFLYNRPAPHQVDSQVRNLSAVTGLPAYPSEDAVLSGVSVELLKALFPAAIEEITLMAAEQRSAALWSGKATASDISAGLAFGKAVAQQVMARAGADGMRNAVGVPADWKKMEDECIARGEGPWRSLESPARAPMLPLFGNVQAWNMTAEDITRERPLPPPSTSSENIKKELEEVRWYAQNATREHIAIVHKWADGVGTYTPPGHWNDIATEYIYQARFSEVRTARAYALLNMALHDAAVGCWNTKFFYFNPRPSQMDPSIRANTGVPNFPSFTSGHSTFSGSAAAVLAYLFPGEQQYFHDQALEASNSRLYGAIHYRSDVEMGLEHGHVIGGYTVAFARQDGADQ